MLLLPLHHTISLSMHVQDVWVGPLEWYSTLSLVLYASMVMIAEDDDRSIGKSATSRKTISRNRPGHKEERYHADTVHCGIVGRSRCETGNIRVLVSD